MKLKLFLIGIFALLSLVAYQTYSSFTPNSARSFPTSTATVKNQTVSDIQCGELKLVVDTITNSLPKNIKYTVRIYNNEPNRTFMWRQDATTPVFSYLGETSQTINLYSYSLLDNNYLVKTQILPKLKSLGFATDNAQLNPAEWEGTQYYYGLDKDDFHYSIKIGEMLSDITQNDNGEILSQELPPPENSSAISIICGEIDDELNRKVYDKINSVAKYSNKTILGIWENLDNVISVNISELGSFGGYGQYWLLRGQEIRKISEGQDTPLCEIFEQIKAGKGYACYDVANSVIRGVAY